MSKLKIRLHETRKAFKNEGDALIQRITSLIPVHEPWDSQTQQRIKGWMDTAMFNALGESYKYLGGHVGDEDEFRYDLDVEYNDCKVTLRAFGGNYATYMDVFVYYEGGKNGYGTAYGPENGLETLDNLKEVIDDLCEKAKADADA